MQSRIGKNWIDAVYNESAAEASRNAQ